MVVVLVEHDIPTLAHRINASQGVILVVVVAVVIQYWDWGLGDLVSVRLTIVLLVIMVIMFLLLPSLVFASYGESK